MCVESSNSSQNVDTNLLGRGLVCGTLPRFSYRKAVLSSIFNNGNYWVSNGRTNQILERAISDDGAVDSRGDCFASRRSRYCCTASSGFCRCWRRRHKQSVGERLAKKGVKLLSHYGTTEIDAITPIFVLKPDYDWHYLRLRTDLDLRVEPMTPIDSGPLS